MKPIELKVARIGNSRGVRLPAVTLERYHIAGRVVMEERADGILLRPIGRIDQKLSWEDMARDMAAHTEDWSAWESISADGLESIPWETPRARRVAEGSPVYPKPKKRSRKTNPGNP